MKQLVIDTLLKARAFKSRRQRKRFGQKEAHVVLVSSPSPGNRGDQAMVLASVGQLLDSAELKRLTVVFSGIEQFDLSSFDDPRLETRSDLWLAFSAEKAGKEQLELANLFAEHTHALILGADVLDESYGAERSHCTFRVAGVAAKCGLDTRILGFSMSKEPSVGLSAVLEELPGSIRYLTRDRLSRDRMRKAVAEKRIELVADCAFLLSASEPDDLPAGVREVLRSPKPVLGVSASLTLCGGDEDRRRVLGQGLAEVASQFGLKVLFIPHGRGDEEVLDVVAEPIRHKMPDEACMAPLFATAEAKWLLGQCDHVVSGRMHSAIAALGMGRPVTCIPYRGKFAGLMEHFGLTDAILSADDIGQSPENITDYLRGRWQATDTLAKQVQSALPRVKDWARKNFELFADKPA
jgi:polysaccharide pyruvyl transferase WcaK-like protein